jgi:hypothetical protein
MVLEQLAYLTPLWHGVALSRDLSLGGATVAGTLLHALYLGAWIVGGFLAAGIRAGEEQRAAGIIRAGEIRGRIHRSSRETAAGYGASTSDGRQQPLS